MIHTKGSKKRQIRALRPGARMEVHTNAESEFDDGDTEGHTENVQSSQNQSSAEIPLDADQQVAGALGSGDEAAGSTIQIGSDDALGSDDGDGSHHGGGYTGYALVAAPANSSLPGMLPVAPFGLDATFIPGRLTPETFTADTIEPWSAKKLNRVAIATITITILYPELPFRTEWIFLREEDDMPASGSNVEKLHSTTP
ncbi:hypothetical protein PInf_010567 [Phytophthora infestans]|nr:hypothetical protein PInf_010567 [Phytophthora infestans]